MRDEKPFQYLVTTGDNFYAPDGVATEKTFHRPMGCLRRAGVLWRATWGNHDIAGRSTGTTLGSPKRFFTWTSGGVDFFMLDSNAVDAAQTNWLEESLKGSDAPVKIAVFHHPPFTAGLHAPAKDVQRAWVPLFERFRVALVLSGHNHDYEHSTVSNVHYVVSGGGGARTYTCLGFPSYLLTCRSLHHFLLVEVRGQNLVVSAVDRDGKVFDSFSLKAM